MEKLVLLACIKEDLSRDVYFKVTTQREEFFDYLIKEELSRDKSYYKVFTQREEFFEDHI